MHDDLIVSFNLVALAAFVAAAVVAARRRHRADIGGSAFVPLVGSLLLYAFIVSSNVVEHADITASFDPLEDIAEVVFTFMFLFFVNNWRKDRSEARFRALFVSAPLALAEVAPDGRVLEVNQILTEQLRQLFGMAVADVPTMAAWLAVAYPDPAYRAEVEAAWAERVREAFASGRPIAAEERDVTCADGTLRRFLVGGNPIGENVLVSFVDVTDRLRSQAETARLQEQLLQAQKLEAIGVLAGGVAHDFNNMLGAIIGFTELTMDELEVSHPVRPNLVEILTAAQKSATLTRQLLTFARKQKGTPTTVGVDRAVGDLLGMLRRMIGENIELAWQPGAEGGTVRMDPTQFDQIVANLCVNARDAISDVGRITVATSLTSIDATSAAVIGDAAPGEYVLISVTDTGCGMDKATKAHIFEPFFTTKAPGQGTGLGLATVYGIVKQADGRIAVYSEPGVGTTFNVFLPRHLGEVGLVSPTAPAEVPRGRGERVLVVEDDPLVARMCATMLERLGYTYVVATSPREALRLIDVDGAHLDLLLTDVIMPEMNGRELRARIAQVCPQIKHVFMSGYTADILAGDEAHADHFLRKPFAIRELGVKLRQVLDAA
ncbi:MAG: response regulator [Deltaproteobacteria bacterium]|nr:response regulator [Deltaproteobacteria bacterium]